MSEYRFLVVGAGKSGLSAALFIHQFNFKLFISDTNKISENTKILLNSKNILYEECGHSFDKLKEYTTLVLSPGILSSSQIVLKAMNAGLSIINEIELAQIFISKYYQCHFKLIAITGTNGKSTTTNYCAQLFAKENKNSFALGNIGTSFCEWLLNIDKKSQETYIISLELSSYQLENIYTLQPDVTVFLNIQNDHLARYETLEEYFKAKWRLILMTKETGTAILTFDVLKFALHMGLEIPSCEIIILSFNNSLPIEKIKNKFNSIEHKKNHESLNRKLPTPFYKELKNQSEFFWIEKLNLKIATLKKLEKNNSYEFLFLKNDSYQKIMIENSCLPGFHNAMNISFANLAGLSLDIVDVSSIISQWERIPQHINI